MKRLLILVAIISYSPFIKAQDLGDAVRYSGHDLNGTARYISMGGAFDALGGDLSAIKINPAGSAVFLSNEISFSIDNSDYKNKTTYNNTNNTYHNNDVSLNQAGVVFVFNNTDEEATVSRLSFGVTYDRDKSFKNRWNAVGTSQETVSDMFLDAAQGVPLDLFALQNGESITDLYSYLGYANEGFLNSRLQNGFLGYQAHIIDPVDNSDINNVDYTSNASGNSFDHAYHSTEHGLSGKISFNGAIALKNRFYFGLNLNSHVIDYDRTTVINERVNDPTSYLKEVNFLNYLQTKGNGFSMQLGGIAKLNDMFRVSLTYDSPIWYNVYNEETNQILHTNTADGEFLIDPEVTNVYGDYRFRTPGKVSVGAAAVFGGSGLLSLGYSYQDYSNIKYTSDGFNYLNTAIDHNLQAVNAFHIGGEYRIKHLSVRAGYRYEDSPYKNGKTIGDLQGYSAGIGYDFGGFKLDFAYDLAQRDYENTLLNTGFDQTASIKNSLSHYVLSFVFPF